MPNAQVDIPSELRVASEEIRETEERTRHRLKLFRIDQAFQAPRRKRWIRDWKLYYGLHWQRQQGDDPRSAKPVIPKTRSAIDNRLAHLTTNRPRFVMIPRKPEDAPFTELATDIMDEIYENQRIQWKWSQSMLSVLVTGVAWARVGWDEDANDVSVDYLDEFSVFIDPEARGPEDAMRITYAQNISLRKLRWYYRSNKEILARLEDIKPGVLDPSLTLQVNDMSRFADRALRQMTTGAAESDGTAHAGLFPTGGTDESKGLEQVEEDMVTLLEVWERQDDGSITRSLQANFTELVNNEPSPYEDGEMPFTLYRRWPDMKMLYSSGLASYGEGLQLIINKLESQKLDIMALAARPILLIPADANIGASTIKVYAGLVLTYAGERPPNWLQSSSPPGELFIESDRLGEQYDRHLGDVAIARGERPVGVESGRALQVLGQKASVRLDREAMWIEDDHSRLGKLIWNRVKQYYDDRRVLRRIKAGSPLQFVLLNEPQASGQLLNHIRSTLDFDVRLEIGPNLPTTRMENFQKAFAIYGAGGYGPPGSPIAIKYLLQAAEDPRAETIAAEVGDFLQAQMKAAEKMEAAKQGGEGAEGGGGGGQGPVQAEEGQGVAPAQAAA